MADPKILLLLNHLHFIQVNHDIYIKAITKDTVSNKAILKSLKVLGKDLADTIQTVNEQYPDEAITVAEIWHKSPKKPR